jgi:hypothetical protein
MAAARGDGGRLFTGVPRPRTGPMWARDDPVASAMFAAGAVGGGVARVIGRLRPGHG